MKKMILVCAVGLVLTGCATKPVSNEDAKPVPLKQVIDASLLDKKEGTGQVIIKRDSGIFGSACLSRVYVDGKEVADIDPSQKLTIYPTIGDHIFSSWPKGICGGGMSEQAGKVVEDKTLMYRIGYGSNGEYGIHPTAF
ncbi:hypothetical protein CQK57_03325 [Salmonella enterica]|uniref:hypothetical protein n=1 Tax=Salmonella enterica TaxID=28901 RepID=UPI0009B11C21|nr:hypothetical protein [Salmonella enterica]EBG8067287.1 hypothetical protein [Salmonella enterica subsp. enterica serovar Elisabethville]EBW3368484.1 hypothetical protein [Salmonella enterica subsp. enterica serovar Wangata]ECE5861204.1 hypothetical protein [Salmonella enterica subsp. enterica]ECF4097072.1 hypothetical protein [Salmonella enterica subsp. enterica serovar Adelaide]ECK7391189.1 hypothetical protein [Salmonella enterica subsp. enterica serovar Meleagridis]